MHRDPREERSIKIERVEASSLPRTSKHTRSFIEGSTVMKTVLKVVGVFGVSLVMSGMICQTMFSSHQRTSKGRRLVAIFSMGYGSPDYMLTCNSRWYLDACSIRTRSYPRVFSASLKVFLLLLICSRLRIVDESISTATIVGVSCTILVLLFLVQPFGKYPKH